MDHKPLLEDKSSQHLPENALVNRPKPPQQARRWAVVGVLVLTFLALVNAIPAIVPYQARYADSTVEAVAPVTPVAAVDSAASVVQRLTKNAVAAVPLLRNFQVYPPVYQPTPSRGAVLTDGFASVPAADNSNCSTTQTLMTYSFGNSYGKPFVGAYTPPTACPGFNRITWNFTVVSAGRQFDRLAIAYFGDTELWRTSTAEPTQNGIVWTYIKDMTQYYSLFTQRQKLIFDLGNLINDIYTAPFNATLQATFFRSEDTVVPADAIIPISARQGSQNMPSAFQYPAAKAVNTVTLPKNPFRIVFSVSATGQSAEEFWYSNVLSSNVDTFGPDAGLLPYSPFREVQVYVDGTLAGVAWPFPIIFTGGIVPGLWRPIVGIDAFDLREDEIDLSPWIPVLSDGKPHTFEIRVAGISDNGRGQGSLNNTVGSYWVLTGKIFVWTNVLEPGPIGGTRPRIIAPPPTIQLASKVVKDSKGVNKTLTYAVGVTRNLTVSADVRIFSPGDPVRYVWTQVLTYNNSGVFTNYGATQLTNQTTQGANQCQSDSYALQFTYPLVVNTTVTQAPNSNDFSIDATLLRGQQRVFNGIPVFPSGLQAFNNTDSTQNYQLSQLSTLQNGAAHYESLNNNKQSLSYGMTEQVMAFFGVRSQNAISNGALPQARSVYPNVFPQPAGSNAAAAGPTIPPNSEAYYRDVLARNASVVRDDERVLGQPFNNFPSAQGQAAAAQAPDAHEFGGGRSVRQLLGRGPAR